MGIDKTIDIMKDIKLIHQSLIGTLEEELKDLPVGRLISRRIRNSIRYYYCQGKANGEKKLAEKYISQDCRELVQKLMRRQFVEKSLHILRNNIKAEECFIRKYLPYEPEDIVEGISKTHKGAPYEFLPGYSNNPGKPKWVQEPYIKNESYPDGLIHNTVSGLKVRSKSESIIVGLLEAYKIPFRYEAQLSLGSQTFYPDFTILRPKDGQILYWEHFGKADDRKYSISMYQKIETYINNGIIPGIDLIVTFETERAVVDQKNLTKVIKAYIIE